MKLHATKTILLTIYLIGAQVYAHQLDIDGSESAGKFKLRIISSRLSVSLTMLDDNEMLHYLKRGTQLSACL